MIPLNKYIISLRKSRVWHRYTGLTIALLLFISAITGVALALKKDIDLLQPPTNKGVAKELTDWKPLYELSGIASAAFEKRYPDLIPNPVDRMDVRPTKGIVKVLLKNGYWEVQVDGATGEVLSIAQRHSDWIEQLHDGSIISNWFKIGAMNLLGWGAVLLILTGLWLHYGPEKYRAVRRKSKQKR